MRRSAFKLYGPFAAIVLVQAVLILVAPSNAPDRTSTYAGGTAAGTAGSPAGQASGQTGTSTGGSGTTSSGAAATAGGAPGSGATAGPGGGSAATSGAAPGAQGTPPGVLLPPGVAASGDTSHCVGDRQFDVLINDPPCYPRFEGDNGGATYRGVTADSVRVILFESEPNEQVNAILATQGLAATEEELAAFYAAAEEFIEANYELYGRDIEFIRYQGACPSTPPDVPACLEAAREVVRMDPFMVVFGTPLYDRIFDEWARAGIVSVGGWHFDNSYFVSEGRRGFRYDLFMDGTRSVEMIAEYYCKKMAGGPASHAGALIHPSIGGRNTPRRLGISTPEIDANVRAAEHLVELIRQCAPNDPVPVISTYQSNIETAVEQTNATVARWIAEKVTTLTCLCDPIAPAFGTRGNTEQGYFPEFLMPGLGLLDYDKLGRLYDPQQMQHAFGLGHLAEPIPHSETDAVRVWRATGRSGEPCKGCNLQWGYMSFVGSAIMGAGPNLTPAAIEQAILNAVPYGGDIIGTQRIEFGPDDYTALSDAREIYWCASCTSRIDGQTGAYISPNDARRYRLGEWGPGLDQIPVSPS